MDIKKIRDLCWKYDCVGCPFYDVSTIIGPEGPYESSECLFYSIPQQWDVKEIERRLNEQNDK